MAGKPEEVEMTASRQHGICAFTVLSLLVWLGATGSSHAKTASISAPQSAPSSRYEIVWIRHSDDSLWLTDYPSGGDKKIYGREVNGASIVPGSDGISVAVGDTDSVALFDTHKPGTRKSVPKRSELTDVWAYEMTHDCSGVLISKHAPNEQEAIYTGMYMARPDGSQSLVARPKRKGLADDVRARYSPDFSKLLLRNLVFMQVIDIHTNKTLIYKEFASLPGGLTGDQMGDFMWLDNDRIVAGGSGLLLVNVKTGSITCPWVDAVEDATSLAYARDAKQLYVFGASERPVLYRVDSMGKRCDRLTLPRLKEITELLSVSSDGRLALFNGAGSSGGVKSDTFGLWVVELSTGRYTFISDSGTGIFMGARSCPGLVTQQNAIQSKP